MKRIIHTTLMFALAAVFPAPALGEEEEPVSQAGLSEPFATESPPAPPHWYQRHSGEPSEPVWEPPPSVPARWDWYFRIDGGAHKEVGFPDRQGAGFELDGRLFLPDMPWFSLVGEIRNEVLTHGNDRLSWTFGGVSDAGPVEVALGVDGVYDDLSDSHVGSIFFYVGHEITPINGKIGLWTTAELWDDVRETFTDLGGGAFAVTVSGVIPYEQTRVFYSQRLGPYADWGEIYIAPGVEHRRNDFVLSTGFQATIWENVDGFVHFHKTFDGDRDWSLFAGIQLHLGSGDARPWDFMMPNRIRARERQGSSTVFFFP